MLSPVGGRLDLRRSAVWFFASTLRLSLLGCATRPVELNPRSSLSNQARKALRNGQSGIISDQQAAAWDLVAGVVPYRSSHLTSAESELTVPGDYGSYRLPQANAELRRILLEHLRKKISPAQKGETKVTSQALRKRQVDPQHGVRFN
jgi:hypothetical protein